jgi:hypothetical protein
MLDAVEPNIIETSKLERKLMDIWREIKGANNREGSFDPMGNIFPKEIIMCGEFVQECYDGFDFDPFSKY